MSKSKKSLQKMTNLDSRERHSDKKDFALAKQYLAEMKRAPQNIAKEATIEEENLVQRLEMLQYEKARRINGMYGKKQAEAIEECERKSPEVGIKNRQWEFNHVKITTVIHNFIQENNYMPSASDIATRVGLSRQTVNKHIREYGNSPDYLDQMEQFKILTGQVLTQVVKCAMNGDMRAAKLFMESVGNLKTPPQRFSGVQNNYLQINNTLVTEEMLKRLAPKQLQKIERILKLENVLGHAAPVENSRKITFSNP